MSDQATAHPTDPAGDGSSPLSSAQVLLWFFLATVGMLFTALLSAYLVRSAASDWQRIELPAILRLNTLVLLGASVALEAARLCRRRDQAGPCLGALLAAFILGAGFLAGQLMAWRQLRDAGIYLPSNPFGSFFYVLTGVHAVHLAGGLLFLAALSAAALLRGPAAPSNSTLRSLATYWHFLALVWVALFIFINVF